jgi:hypothetical protein
MSEITAWVLIILIKGTTPPTGVVVEGFLDEKACLEEAKQYCDNQLYRCACRPSVR